MSKNEPIKRLASSPIGVLTNHTAEYEAGDHVYKTTSVINYSACQLCALAKGDR